MLYLEELSFKNFQKEYQFLQEIKSENGFENKYYNISLNDYLDEIIIRDNASKGINLEPNHVSDTYCFLYNDDVIVGLFKIRHYLNDSLRDGAGHIGFIIHPKYRGRNYATHGLSHAINKLKSFEDFNDEEVYLSCNVDNLASLNVIKKNKGYIIKTENNKHFLRIKL